MISVKDALDIHDLLIEKFGGKSGIRDTGLLESALARPFSTFDGNELYSSVEEKAAAIIESILINHPFMDGNKRTGYVLMRLLLLNNYLDINATEDDKYTFVIMVASGKLKYDGILKWIKNHVEKY